MKTLKPDEDRSKITSRDRSQWKKLFYGVICSLWIATVSIISIDVLTVGPCTRMFNDLLDYALPVLDDPDISKTTKDFVLSRGFEFESHEVTTQDGYIIEFHRIYNRQFRRRAPLVIGMPLLCSSTVLLSDFRNNTGAYVFADAGYDVWVTNVRGNSFGRRHVSLDPEKDKLQFYNFTFVDIGEIDLAAQIDYVLKHTGYAKVHYVGTSQGAAIFFALLSKRPSYNSKIHSMVSYGGFQSMCYTANQGIKTMSYLTWPLSEIILKFESLAAILTRNVPMMDSICTRVPYTCGLIALTFGFKHEHYLNMSRFGVYMKHMPAGTSLKNLVYYGQTISKDCDGSIREFNYDAGPITELFIFLGWTNSKNFEVYGKEEPPIIDFSKVRIPVKLYYSDGDDFVTPSETMNLAKTIGVPEEHIHRIEDPLFTHVNYVFNKKRKDFLFHTIDFFKGVNSSWPWIEMSTL